MTAPGMIQGSRLPSAAVLLVVCTVAAVYWRSTPAQSHPSEEPTLAQLEVAIADAEAGAEVWLLYAQRLHQAGRLAHAAAAYQRVLELDPFQRTANVQGALVWGQLGDAEALYGFLERLLLVDPRLTLDLLGRPQLQRYLAAERFQALLARARAQSMD